MAQKRKQSPSDLNTRNVVSKKKSANVMGATGAAMAAEFIREWTNVGEALNRMRVSQKDKLLQLIGLDKASLVQFHGAMLAEVERINGLREDAKVTNPAITSLRMFFDEVNPALETPYVQASMWKGLALAVDAGWRPDAEHIKATKWAALTMEATEKRDSVGKPSNDPKNPEAAQSNKRKRGRAPVIRTPAQKAVTAVKNALKDDKGAPLPANNRNLAEVVAGICADATVEELTEVAAKVQSMLDAAKQAKETAGKALAKAGQSASKVGEVVPNGDGTSTQITHTGATVKRTEAAAGPTKTRGKQQKREHATAKGR